MNTDSNERQDCRLFILGAGFSCPAGLPTAAGLFPLICKSIESDIGKDTQFHADLKNFISYKRKCDSISISEDGIDLEEFMTYLDIEHSLGLLGSDTWSDEGNVTQLMIRQAIGSIISERTPLSNKLPDVYYQFASNLTTLDTVFSFNYDLVLERAFAHVGKPFRRFPDRYKKISLLSAEVDTSTDETILLKMHGSIDWFDIRTYQELEAVRKATNSPGLPNDPIFANPSNYGARPLVEGLLPQSDNLKYVYEIANSDSFYQSKGQLKAPLLLSPSHVKFLYADPLLSFWNGLNRCGGYNQGLSVIGFSLPKHDDYIRMIIYNMTNNYKSWWNEKIAGRTKDYMRFVDLRRSYDEIQGLKERYRFVDPNYSRYHFDGFNENAIKFLFENKRQI